MKSFQHLSTLCPHSEILHGNARKIRVCHLPFRGLARPRKRTQTKKRTAIPGGSCFSHSSRSAFYFKISFFRPRYRPFSGRLVYQLYRRLFMRVNPLFLWRRLFLYFFCKKIVLFLAIFAKIRNITNFFNFFCALPLDTDKIKL